jgi:ubiquinone/menaquinone biosynthesis C-methylase UbiE
MKRATLELLRCPHCRGTVSLRNDGGDGMVVEGDLFCAGCGLDFPIRNGVPHFVGHEEVEGLNRSFTRFYDWFSWVYPFLMKVVLLSFGGDRKARKEILDRLELRGGRTLEVSVGTGANLPYLFESEDVGEVYGLDISAGQLARCSSLVARRGWPVDLFLGTAEALPFKSDCFDSVLHIGGINFLR